MGKWVSTGGTIPANSVSLECRLVFLTSLYQIFVPDNTLVSRIIMCENQRVLGNQRAEYVKQIVAQVATQLAWSHVIEILPLNDGLLNFFFNPLVYSFFLVNFANKINDNNDDYQLDKP